MSSETNLKIVAPERLPVSFAGSGSLKPEHFEGKAGVSVQGEQLLVSFPGTKRGLKGCAEGTVDGQTVKVVFIEDSAVVAGMVRILADPIS